VGDTDAEGPAGPVLVLVGPPGAGKTTVGALVAGRLGVAFRDTDDDVVALAGASVADIFVDHGEVAFRAWEELAVVTAMREHTGVLALGGGAVLSATTRGLLTGRRVAFLDVDAAEAARRVGLARDRPVLALNPRARLRTLLAERRPLYEEVSALTVSTAGRDPDAVAEELLRLTAVPP
jgi:shikimate kinase